jgi:hypothetical protein
LPFRGAEAADPLTTYGTALTSLILTRCCAYVSQGILVDPQRSLLLVERVSRSIGVYSIGVLKDPLGMWKIRYEKMVV